MGRDTDSYPQKRCANPHCRRPIDRHMDFCSWDCVPGYFMETFGLGLNISPSEESEDRGRTLRDKDSKRPA